MAEKRERLLGDDAESPPAIGGIGIGVGGVTRVAARFGEGGPSR
jgi:hypothetical protein